MPPLLGTSKKSRQRSYSVQFSNAGSKSDQIGEIRDRLIELQSRDFLSLREEWSRLNGSAPPRLSRDLMLRYIAYYLQVEVYGGLSAQTLRTLEVQHELIGEESKLSETPQSSLSHGARLVREWHGRTHIVEVLNKGFYFEGKAYRSLSEIARRITGSHWSGPRFFGLTKRGK